MFILEWMAENWREREAICAQCPFKSQKICTKCGCFIKTKCKLKNAKCPINKWGKDQEVK